MEPRAKILIIDDEPTLTRPLARMLELMGYAARVAASGEAALDEMERRAFDLVLLDKNMLGMGGIETLRRIKAKDADVIVIIMTAYQSVNRLSLRGRREPTTTLPSLLI